jgi:hypothetical protein
MRVVEAGQSGEFDRRESDVGLAWLLHFTAAPPAKKFARAIQGFQQWAPTWPVSRWGGQPATGPPGSYPDRTHTGKPRRAYEHEGTPWHYVTVSLPAFAGARKTLGIDLARDQVDDPLRVAVSSGIPAWGYPAMAIIIIVSPSPVVVPGEPFSVQWSCTMIGPEPPSVTATLMLGSTQLQAGTFPTEPDVPPPHTSPGWHSGGTLTVNLSPSDSRAKTVYFGFGVKTLQLQLSAGTTGEADVPLTVVQEAIDGLWWVFTAPEQQGVPWGTPYSVEGTFTNKSQWATINGSIAINETGGADANPVSRGSSNFAPVAPGGNVDLTFMPILWNSQTWPWVSPGGIITGDTSRVYYYQPIMTLQDIFGNPYSSILGGEYAVLISVTQTKQFWADTCLAASEAAVTALLWGGLAGLAALFAGAAAGAYFQANDPPVPDPQFQVSVIILTQYLEDKLPIDPPAPQLQHLAVHAFHIVKVIDALGQVEGKILGARQAGDEQALSVQTEARQRFLEELRSEVISMLGSVGEAADELERLINVSEYGARLHLVEVEGIPPTLTQQFDQSGFGSTSRAMVEALLTPERIRLLKQPLGDILRTAAAGLAQVAQSTASTLTSDTE